MRVGDWGMAWEVKWGLLFDEGQRVSKGWIISNSQQVIKYQNTWMFVECSCRSLTQKKIWAQCLLNGNFPVLREIFPEFSTYKCYPWLCFQFILNHLTKTLSNPKLTPFHSIYYSIVKVILHPHICHLFYTRILKPAFILCLSLKLWQSAERS